MPIQVLMPALSPTMEKGNLAKWHKKEGDAVKSGDVIAEIETDKATMEVEAVDEGTLGKILVPEGTNDVAVNTPIAMILGEGEDASALTDGGAALQQKTPVTAPPAKAEQSAPQVNRAPAPAKAEAAAPAPAPTPTEPDLPEGTEMVTMTVREALRDAMAEEMRRDKTVFVMGEEVAEYQGAYKVTQGLLKEFGAQRVVDTPIAESGFTGVGIGAAMVGLRPVVEMMTFNFALLALDQIVNSAAKMHYMSGGQFNVPIVIRGPGGPAAQLAAQHSQSMETYFYHVPGLKVVRPTTPMDAKGLLKSAIRDDNPVIFIESETLYSVKGDVPDDPEFLIPLGKALVRREGTDVTVIAYMGMMYRAMEAAEELEKEGISVELVDPRTLRPMDTETIIGSVRKTHRAVIVEAGAGFAGMGSEIVAFVTEQAFDDLDAPVERVTGANAPMPYARNLEKLKTPSKDKILAAVRRVCNANGG